MLSLLFEFANVQLPSLLLGVSFVFSSYLCLVHFSAQLSSLVFTSSPLSSALGRPDKKAFALSSLSFFSFSASPAPALAMQCDDGDVQLEVFATATLTSSSSSSSSSSPPSLHSSSTTTTTTMTTSTTTTTTTTKAKVSKAKMLRLGSSMGLAIPVALTRRVWKGAAYSSWSVGFELQHEMGQALLRNHHRFSLTDLCQLSADFAADPPANASSVRTIYCGGVRANMIQYRSPCRQPTKARVDDKAKANERDLSKSESSHPVRSASKVAYRTTRRRSLEGDADLSKSSPSPASTPSSSNPSSGNAASTRTKLSLRRVRTDTDNLGRDHHVNQATNDENLESTFDWDNEEEEPAATVLYLHGGGFCVGSATTYRRCLWHFSREMKGLRFLAVDYSLSPHVRFPTALQECLHAYLWLIDENGGNVPPERVVLAGDSAGGCLVLALLFLLRQMRDEAKACADNDQQSSDDNNDNNIKDDDNDGGGLPKGKTEPPFALPSRKTPPAMPLCAFLLSPWVDLSEASSVMQRESYADASTYAAQMGLARRFIAAYLHGVNDPSTAAVDKKKKEKKKEKKKPKELKDMAGGRERANTESAAETTKTTTSAVPDVHSPFISPLYGDLHDLPPMMLTAGGEEPLLADIEALRAKCLDAGLEVEFDVGEHMNHAYQVFHEPSAHREIERSIQAVGRFVWRHIAQRQLLRQSDD